MNKEINFTNINYRKDYLSVDKLTAISAEGEIFEIGDVVKHDDKEAGQATIKSFYFNYETNDVGVNTEKGSSNICFITKI